MLLTSSLLDHASESHAFRAERRRGLRIRQKRPVKVLEPHLGRYYGGQTADISSTGLRIELPASTPLEPGALLTIHVGLTQAGESLANRRGMIPARVVWIDRRLQSPRDRIVLGVEFVTSMAAQSDAA